MYIYRNTYSIQSGCIQLSFISTNRCDCTKHNENALQLFWHLSLSKRCLNYCLSFTVKHCLSKFIITDASYWTSPYCTHSHNGICKENWVVLNVCPAKVEKPWENKTIRWQIKKIKQTKEKKEIPYSSFYYDASHSNEYFNSHETMSQYEVGGVKYQCYYWTVIHPYRFHLYNLQL